MEISVCPFIAAMKNKSAGAAFNQAEIALMAFNPPKVPEEYPGETDLRKYVPMPVMITWEKHDPVIMSSPANNYLVAAPDYKGPSKSNKAKWVNLYPE